MRMCREQLVGEGRATGQTGPMSTWRIAIVFLILIQVQGSIWAVPVPRLVNPGFDLCQTKGIACEWKFQGEGTPVNTGGLQGIEDLPPAGVAYFSQTIPFCSAGVVYRATAVVHDASIVGAQISLGIDPTGQANPSSAQWSSGLATGTTQLSIPATGTNCSLIIAFHNIGKSSGSAFIESVAFEAVGGLATAIPVPTVAPPAVRLAAKAQLSAASDLMKRQLGDDAFALYESVVTNMPEARPEVAVALVGMHEARHMKQFETARAGFPSDLLDSHLGIPYLRQVREQYPDELDSCALATCKLGEFYLSTQFIQMAKPILESVIQDFPNTPGAVWSKVHLVNARNWSGDVAGASALVQEIGTDFKQGKATLPQKAWAEYFIGRPPKSVGSPGTAIKPGFVEFNEAEWETYKNTFPEIAFRAKRDVAETYEDMGEYGKAKRSYEEILKSLPAEPQWTGVVRVLLAKLLLNHGWQAQHRQEALSLLHEVIDNPLSSPFHLAMAKDCLSVLNMPVTMTMAGPPQGQNLLYNPDFEEYAPMPGTLKSHYPGWRLIGSTPNWRLCPWETGVPEPGLGRLTPAWNTEKPGSSGILSATLTHAAEIVSPSALYRTSIWIAAEGWEGGADSDVVFRYKIGFFDGFHDHIADATTSAVRVGRQWREIALTGRVPQDARLAEVSVHVNASGPGQYAAAVTHASLVISREDD